MMVKQDLPPVRGDDDDAAFYADIVQVRKNLYHILLHIPGYAIRYMVHPFNSLQSLLLSMTLTLIFDWPG